VGRWTNGLHAARQAEQVRLSLTALFFKKGNPSTAENGTVIKSVIFDVFRDI
jgi:hypothetical protein